MKHGNTKDLCMLAELLQLCQLFATSWTAATRLLCSRDSLGKNTGVGCRALLQGIFPIEGWNLRLLRLLPWQAGHQCSIQMLSDLCLFPLDDLEEYKLPGVCAPLQHYVLRCLVTVLPFISFSISLILRTQLLLFLFNLKEEMATHCSMFSQQQY